MSIPTIHALFLARAAFLAAGTILFSVHAAGAAAVAKVGAVSISRETLERAVQQSVSATYFHKQVGPDALRQISKDRLRELVRREHAALAAADAGLPVPVQEARRRCAEIEKQLGTKGYAESLMLNGWTRDQHVREVAKTLLADEAFRRFVTAPSAVSEAEVRATYETAPERWRMPEAAHVEHILVRANGPDDDAGAEERAASVAGRIRAGESFAALAAAFSADDYRVKGGDLGWVHRGRLLPEVDAVVFTVDPGSVPAPVRSKEGWHVVRVVERRPVRQLTFEEAAPRIRKDLEEKKRAEIETAWFASIAAKHPVTILDPELVESP